MTKAKPIPIWLLLHHDLTIHQDVFFVIHDFRKGIFDIRRVNNMNREMPGFDSNGLES
jgi:hypothetical protein